MITEHTPKWTETLASSGAMYNKLGYAVAVVAILLFTGELWLLGRSIGKARDLENSPIEYSEFVPDKPEYVAGEIVHFSATRIVKPTKTQPLPLLLLQMDSFENVDTGEIFAGTIASRIIRKPGTTRFEATRRLPLDCSAGTYVFDGWASSQTARLSRASAYSSKSFKVRAPQTGP